jgi:signal transduction histidine kinase
LFIKPSFDACDVKDVAFSLVYKESQIVGDMRRNKRDAVALYCFGGVMFLAEEQSATVQEIDRSLSDAIMDAHILIVDDNLANVELLREILFHSGYKNIVCETDSRKFRDLCANNQFDILLLDIRMPYLSGFDLIAMAREEIYAGDLVPILVLTAQTDLDTRRKSLQLGANDFLNKPFVAWELLHRVRNALSTRMLYRKVVGQNQTLERRVEERTAELSQALVAAREGERAKLDFLSMMSHELRTPLNAVIGFAEVMAAPGFAPLSADDVREYAGLVEENGKSLLAMVNKLLDFTRSGAELAESDFSLRRIVQTCMEQLSAKALAREVSVDFGVFEGAVLRADRRRVKEMLLALLENAIKFNTVGGKVEISACSDAAADMLRIAVADTGPGVPAAEADKLFAPFYQSDASLHRGHDGIGLGLPVVRRYAEMHGGSVEIEPGEVGALFVIKLPLSRVIGQESCAPQPIPSFR